MAKRKKKRKYKELEDVEFPPEEVKRIEEAIATAEKELKGSERCIELGKLKTLKDIDTFLKAPKEARNEE